MKNLKFTIVAAVVMCLTISCGNKQQTAAQTETQNAVAAVMDVDSLLAGAEALVDKEVVFDGVCTHACKHGATKIFMMGSDDTKSIRVEAAKLGSFDTKCINSIVEVKGILREERVDEDYLQKWEAKVKAQGGKDEHGEEGGCSSEKNARGETANTVEGRIADFRAKIAKNQEATGKAYLSFYFVEALSYEIK